MALWHERPDQQNVCAPVLRDLVLSALMDEEHGYTKCRHACEAADTACMECWSKFVNSLVSRLSSRLELPVDASDLCSLYKWI